MSSDSDKPRYRIILGKDFLKSLKKIVKSGKIWVKEQAQEAIDEIKFDPYTKRPNAQIKLISTREERVYRVRLGAYRMTYEVDEKEKKIEVTLIFHKGSKGYKKIKRK